MSFGSSSANKRARHCEQYKTKTQEWSPADRSPIQNKQIPKGLQRMKNDINTKVETHLKREHPWLCEVGHDTDGNREQTRGVLRHTQGALKIEDWFSLEFFWVQSCVGECGAPPPFLNRAWDRAAPGVRPREPSSTPKSENHNRNKEWVYKITCCLLLVSSTVALLLLLLVWLSWITLSRFSKRVTWGRTLRQLWNNFEATLRELWNNLKIIEIILNQKLEATLRILLGNFQTLLLDYFEQIQKEGRDYVEIHHRWWLIQLLGNCLKPLSPQQ